MIAKLVSNISTFLPLIIGLVVFKALNSRFRAFLILLAIEVIAEFVSGYLASQGTPNLWIFGLLGQVEVSMLCVILMLEFSERRGIVAVGMAMLIYLGVSSFFVDYGQFSALWISLNALLVSIATLVWFVINARKPDYSVYWPVNYIIFGLLIYFPLLILSVNGLLERGPFEWDWNYVANVVTNLLFASGFISCWIHKRSSYSRSLSS